MHSRKIDTNFNADKPWTLDEAYEISLYLTRADQEVLCPGIYAMGGGYTVAYRIGNGEYMIIWINDKKPRQYGILDHAGYEKTYDAVTKYLYGDYRRFSALIQSIEDFAYYNSDEQKCNYDNYSVDYTNK